MQTFDLLTAFLNKLEAKDWIMLIASLSALMVSVLSYRQRSSEGRLALRKQLTDVLEKLSELNTEAAMHRLKPDEYPANYGGLLNDKRRFLVRQATFLMDSVGTLVSPYEYLLVAGAYGDINDTYQAEAYFVQAMHASDESIDKGIAIRSFARFLFSQGPSRHDHARRYCQSAADLFVEKNDRHRIYLGDTFVRWAQHEQEWRNYQDATGLYAKAAAVFQNLDNPNRREEEGARVAQLADDCPRLTDGAPRTAA